MRTVSRVVALVATLSVLAACGTDPEPQFEADPTPAPTTSTPTAPSTPEPWEEKSDEGAIAFVEHWIDVFNESAALGETEDLRAISSSACETCANFADLTDDIYGEGGSVTAGRWRIESTSEPQSSAGTVLISLDIKQDPQTIVKSAGAQPTEYPGGNLDYLATLDWRKGEWTMLRLDIVQ